MRSFARPSFFRVFDLLASVSNSGLKLSKWTHDGVDIERERHSFTGPQHGLSIEIFTLTRAGRRGWTLIVAKEFWWVGNEGRPIKATRWAKPVAGERADIMAWFRAQEAMLDRQLAVGGASTVLRPLAASDLDEVEQDYEFEDVGADRQDK
jgi:hypothetical protein